MRVTPRSEAEAKKASKVDLWPPATLDAIVRGAFEDKSSKERDMLVLDITVFNAEGGERNFRDYLTDTPRGAEKLRNACIAVGALAKFEAGVVLASDFHGEVRVKIGVEKRKGWPARNVILDYEVAVSVVALRRSEV